MQYLASLYWTIATLMSVGYGDISANNKPERLFALITMVRMIRARKQRTVRLVPRRSATFHDMYCLLQSSLFACVSFFREGCDLGCCLRYLEVDVFTALGDVNMLGSPYVTYSLERAKCRRVLLWYCAGRQLFGNILGCLVVKIVQKFLSSSKRFLLLHRNYFSTPIRRQIKLNLDTVRTFYAM